MAIRHKVGGVTIGTAYETITFWIYANGHIAVPSFVDHPLYLVICIYGVFFVGTAHFYCIHPLSHWSPLYKISHQLHHQYFDLNYGNTTSPLDKVFGSWHDGSQESLMAQKARGRDRRKAKVSKASTI